MPQRPLCVVCGLGTVEPLLDLGDAPVILGDTAGHPATEPGDATAALRIVRCDRCGVLQLEDTLSAQQRSLIASDTSQRPYAGRPDAARRFCEQAIDRWDLRGDGHVIEVGSGTGSLLRFFRAWQLPVLGIEPDAKLARYARLRRVPTWRATFDAAIAGRVARSDMHADLLIVSTPSGAADDIVSRFASAATVLRPGGVLTIEVPDVLRIIGRTRFDSLRHSDQMLPTIRQLRHMAAAHALDVVDVERPSMAADRLRVWLRRRGHGTNAVIAPRLRTRLRAEIATGTEHADTVAAFADRVRMVRAQVRGLLDHARRSRHSVALWGTSPEAVTIAGATGLTDADVAFAVDPGPCPLPAGATLRHTGIPVVGPADVGDRRPGLVLALDDLAEPPPGWEDVPIYAVSDLVDVVHHMTV